MTIVSSILKDELITIFAKNAPKCLTITKDSYTCYSSLIPRFDNICVYFNPLRVGILLVDLNNAW